MRPAANVAALTGVLSLACTTWLTGRSEAPAAPTPAAAPIRALRLHVAERVAVVADGDVGAGFDERLRAAVQRALADSGLSPVLSSAEPSDLVLRLETRVEGAAGFIKGRASLAAEREGAPLETATVERELHESEAFPTAVARKLVAALLRSPSVERFAAARAGAAPGGGPGQAGVEPPRSREEAVEIARARSRQGGIFFNLGRYREALGEFEAAYLAAPDPALLYNIAQCHRNLGNRGEALRFYRTYLRNAPDAPNRADVERRIKELEGEGRRR